MGWRCLRNTKPLSSASNLPRRIPRPLSDFASRSIPTSSASGNLVPTLERLRVVVFPPLGDKGVHLGRFMGDLLIEFVQVLQEARDVGDLQDPSHGLRPSFKHTENLSPGVVLRLSRAPPQQPRPEVAESEGATGRFRF